MRKKEGQWQETIMINDQIRNNKEREKIMKYLTTEEEKEKKFREIIFSKIEKGMIVEIDASNERVSSKERYMVLKKMVLGKNMSTKTILGKLIGTNKIEIIPISDLNVNILISTIATHLKGEEFINQVLNPTPGNYSTVDILDSFNVAYEVEGGLEDLNEYEFEDIGFRVEYDGSVSTEARYGDKEFVVEGYEKGKDIIPKTEELLELLDEYGFTSNETCGVHIHISKVDEEFSASELIKISRLFNGIEREIFSFLPEFRMNKQYSQPLKKRNKGYSDFVSQSSTLLSTLEEEDNIRNILGVAWYDQKNLIDITNNKYNSTRYSAFNMHSFFYRGTIEFRYFNSEPKMLPYWMEWMTKLCKYAMSSSYYDIDNFIRMTRVDREVMFEKIGMTENTKDIIEANGESDDEDYYDFSEKFDRIIA